MRRRIAIAGAGNVGRSIANELIEHGHEVLIIERESRALKQATVTEARWIHADACEVAALEQAQLQDCDVVVAATGDDKVNLVLSLLAKTEFGVPRVVARINHPKNEWLFTESWGVDVAVSTPRMLTALVEEAVSGSAPSRPRRRRTIAGTGSGGSSRAARRRGRTRSHARARSRPGPSSVPVKHSG